MAVALLRASRSWPPCSVLQFQALSREVLARLDVVDIWLHVSATYATPKRNDDTQTFLDMIGMIGRPTRPCFILQTRRMLELGIGALRSGQPQEQGGSTECCCDRNVDIIIQGLTRAKTNEILRSTPRRKLKHPWMHPELTEYCTQYLL